MHLKGDCLISSCHCFNYNSNIGSTKLCKSGRLTFQSSISTFPLFATFFRILQELFKLPLVSSAEESYLAGFLLQLKPAWPPSLGLFAAQLEVGTRTWDFLGNRIYLFISAAQR